MITTAAGLTVAIPSLFFYRFFQRRVDDLVVGMEQEALKLIEVMHSERVDRVDSQKAEVAQVNTR